MRTTLVRFALDANIPAHAVDRECPEHRATTRAVERWRSGSIPWALTWGVVHEFPRVATHPRIVPRPPSSDRALGRGAT
jgi:predicted nucleic acid-binding protein